MPSHDICQNAKLALEEVRPLKQAFDDFFTSALSSGDPNDVRLAQEHKQTFLKKMAEVRMQMHAWEKSFVQTHQQELKNSIRLKIDTNEPLTKLEYFVLYEIFPSTWLDSDFDRDLIDFLSTRNHEEDLSVMFDEFSHKIARSFDEITPQTQIYVGKIDELNFFQNIPDSLELIYTSFPEQRIHRHEIKIGGKDETELEELMRSKGHRIKIQAKQIMWDEEFERSIRIPDPAGSHWTNWKLKLAERISLIRLSVADLGFPNGATLEQVYVRAAELGLELCPPEVGPYFRIQFPGLSENELAYVGMEQIHDSMGNRCIFGIGHEDGGSWLGGYLAEEWQNFFLDDVFVFRLRKPEVH